MSRMEAGCYFRVSFLQKLISGTEQSIGGKVSFPSLENAFGTVYLGACYCTATLHAASFKNQVLVLTFRIGSQIVEKHTGKGFFLSNYC